MASNRMSLAVWAAAALAVGVVAYDQLHGRPRPARARTEAPAPSDEGFAVAPADTNTGPIRHRRAHSGDPTAGEVRSGGQPADEESRPM